MQEKMHELIKAHFGENRSPVSASNNALVAEVMAVLDGDIIESPSGADVLEWKIPKRWHVREAYIATKGGAKLVDYNDSPLHLWTHSVSFCGTLSKDELAAHIVFDEQHPDWIPYHGRNGYKYDSEAWGFSVSYNQWMKFEEDEYIVFIDADLDNKGVMLTGDCVIHGTNKETIFFAAHSCHPAIATDGLTNIAVLVELFRILSGKKNKYTYRCIVGSEYFAAASFLSNSSKEDIANLKNGIYLDMLGNRQNFAYQSSFQADSPLDRIVLNVFKSQLPTFGVFDYRGLWGNDEMFYSGPGFCIPTLGIAGSRHPEYHYNTDNLDLVDFDQLALAVDLLMKIIDVAETDYVPVLMYKGPLFLSKYNLYIDPKINQSGYKNIEAIQILANGEKSCFEIADELGIDYFWTKDFFDKLKRHSLIEKREKNLFL